MKTSNLLQTKKSDFSVLSSQRQVLMGIATLWLVLHHSYYLNLSNSPVSSNLIWKVFSFAVSLFKPIGNVGVEIFLICSGLGLYYSFSKNSNLKSFYKKRAIRLLPPCLIIIPIYYAFTNIGIKEYFSSVFLVDYFINENCDFWYIALIIILYAFYPLIHRFVEKNKDITVIIFSAVLIALEFLMVFVLKIELGTRYYFILRIPVFILGVWLGKKSMEKKEIKTSALVILAGVLVLCFTILVLVRYRIIPFNITNSAYIYYFINIPFSISLCILISVFFSNTNIRFLKAIFATFGVISLEIYLLYEQLFKAVKSIANLHDSTYITYCIATFVITVVLSVIVHEISDKLTSVFTKNY